MTMPASCALKLCARSRSKCPEMFLLELTSLVILGMIEPWPECQPEESRLRKAQPEDSSIYIHIYNVYAHTHIYIYIYITPASGYFMFRLKLRGL